MALHFVVLFLLLCLTVETVSLKHTARYFSRLALPFRFEISTIRNVHSKISETHEMCLELQCSTKTGGIIKIDNQDEKHRVLRAPRIPDHFKPTIEGD